MVRRGWRRRLQLLLRRLSGHHRGEGSGAAAIRTQPGASCAGSRPRNAQRTRRAAAAQGVRAACEAARRGGTRGYGRRRRRPARHSLLSSPRTRTLVPPLPPALALPETLLQVLARPAKSPCRVSRGGAEPPVISGDPRRREGMERWALPCLPAPGSSLGECRLSLSPARSQSCRLCLTE